MPALATGKIGLQDLRIIEGNARYKAVLYIDFTKKADFLYPKEDGTCYNEIIKSM